MQQDEEDEESARQVQIDKKKGRRSNSTLIAACRSEDVWMRNLNTSPAVFLQQRFEQESDAKRERAMKRSPRLFRMIWILLLFALCGIRGPGCRHPPQSMVRAHLEPAGPVVAGSEVKLVVDCLTTTWFTEAPNWPLFTVARRDRQSAG